MNDSPLKAIETNYRGIKYRSRTEARWAVYLDELRIAYDYEPEGIDLGGEVYLPDFWLPVPGAWLEVKGVEPNQREVRVARLLSQVSRSHVFIAVGQPSISGEFNLRSFSHGEQGEDCSFTMDGKSLFISSQCQSVCLAIRGSRADLGGIPFPDTAPARLAASQRFGVFETPEQPMRRSRIAYNPKR